MSLAIPTIHMNGTSQKDIEGQLEDARSALVSAMEALQRAAPNGRDYYPQGHDALSLAQKQHHARLKAIATVHDEVTAIFAALPDHC